MIMYHGTSLKNLYSIIADGCIKPGPDGTVYLCETEFDCRKFMYLRRLNEYVILKLNVPKSDIYETFDHNEKFFQCKCYGTDSSIAMEYVIDAYKYESTLKCNKDR